MKRLLTLREGKKEKEKEKRNVHTKEIVLWLKKIHHHFQLCREISASSNPSKRRWQCRAEDKRREKERSFLCFPLLSFPPLPLPSQAPCRVQGEEEGKALYRWVIPSPNPANRSADKQNQEMREKEHPPAPPPPPPPPSPLPLVPLGLSSRKSHSGMAPRTFRKEEKKRERERSVSATAMRLTRREKTWSTGSLRIDQKLRQENWKKGGGGRGGTVRGNPAKNLGQLHRTVFRPWQNNNNKLNLKSISFTHTRTCQSDLTAAFLRVKAACCCCCLIPTGFGYSLIAGIDTQLQFIPGYPTFLGIQVKTKQNKSKSMTALEMRTD